MQSPVYARSRSTLNWKKPLLFGIWAALGSLICALLGEAWLALTMAPPLPPPPPPPVQPPQAVVLVLDTSGSMAGDSLDEMKRAALEYIQRQDLKRTRIGVVSFNSDSKILTPLTRDLTTLTGAINSLDADGTTRMDLGLNAAISVSPPMQPTGAIATIGKAPEIERRSVLLFTDGYPDDFADGLDVVNATRQSANAIRQSNCRLVAVGSDGSDRNFLAELTGDPHLVFAAQDGQFGEAFKLAENAINAPTGHALLQSGKMDNFDAAREMWRISVWYGLLGLGISAALIVSQGAYARRKPSGREVLGIASGLVAGLAAGAFGQWMFAQAGDGVFAVILARLLAWALCGALVGVGISPFIPNLALPRAVAGGALGGWAGAIGFILVSHSASDVVGRLLGAAVIGFCIGLMVVLAEVAFRRAWLHVSYGPKDAFDLGLGAQAVTVGSDRAQCRIFAKETPPLAGTYRMENGLAVLLDSKGAVHSLNLGDKRTFGNVEITLCGDQDSSQLNEAPLYAPQPVGGYIAQPQTSVALAQAPAPIFPEALAQQSAGWVLRGESSMRLPTVSPVTVGRVAGNSVVIPDAGISSTHARITIGGALLTVTDLGSTNGTFINGVRLTANVASPLRPGDSLRLGKLEFIVEKNP